MFSELVHCAESISNFQCHSPRISQTLDRTLARQLKSPTSPNQFPPQKRLDRFAMPAFAFPGIDSSLQTCFRFPRNRISSLGLLLPHLDSIVSPGQFLPHRDSNRLAKLVFVFPSSSTNSQLNQTEIPPRPRQNFQNPAFHQLSKGFR